MTADKIFISYRREDSAGYAVSIKEHLDRSFPKQVFKDIDAIEPGVDFVEAIERALRSCEVAIVIIGKDWLTAKDALGHRRLDDRHDFVRLEVSTVLKRGVRVIPVLVGGAEMPQADLPAGLGPLKRRQALRLSDRDWEYNVGELITVLREALGSPDKPESVTTPEKEISQDDEVQRLRQKFRPLPQPFHLPLEEVLPKAEMDDLRRSEKLIFHTVGNTGGIKDPHMQMLVADCMQKQFSTPRVQDRPTFLYHLGDVVYFYGSAEDYSTQFYSRYAHYPALIFAVAGNHDGDVDPDHPAPSLHGFVRNFCAATAHHNPEAGDSPRLTMTQPNVYWTLDSPLATFIGLYTNVPEGGMLDENQNAWLITELANAPSDRALIVAMHHPVYSLSLRGSASSEYLAGVLERAVKASGRYPDIVLASHAMNYQRFTRTLADRQIPYMVVGAGGYPRLHPMSRQSNGQAIKTPFPMPGQPSVSLDSYSDDRHGFMRVTVTRQMLTGDYFSVPANSRTAGLPAKRIDSFSLDLLQHRVTQPDY